jgi:hypothetical protein
MRRLQIRIGSIIVTLCVCACLLTLYLRTNATGLPFGWWDVRPYLSILYVPIVVWIVVCLNRPRRALLTLAVSGSLLLLLWVDLARPMPNKILLGGEWPRHPMSVLKMWFRGHCGTWFVVTWFARYGTSCDALSLVYAIIMLCTVSQRRTQSHVPFVLAAVLCVLRIGDWLTSGRVIGNWTTIASLSLDYAPVFLFRNWLDDNRGASEILRLLKPLGVAEFVVPASMLVYVLVLWFRSAKSSVRANG